MCYRGKYFNRSRLGVCARAPFLHLPLWVLHLIFICRGRVSSVPPGAKSTLKKGGGEKDGEGWDRERERFIRQLHSWLGAELGSVRFSGGFPYGFGNHLSKIQTISYVFFSPLALAAPRFHSQHLLSFSG